MSLADTIASGGQLRAEHRSVLFEEAFDLLGIHPPARSPRAVTAESFPGKGLIVGLDSPRHRRRPLKTQTRVHRPHGLDRGRTQLSLRNVKNSMARVPMKGEALVEIVIEDPKHMAGDGARVDALGPERVDGGSDQARLLVPVEPRLARVRVQRGHRGARRRSG